MKKTMIAVAVVAAFGAATMATGAMARPGGGGGMGHGGGGVGHASFGGHGMGGGMGGGIATMRRPAVAGGNIGAANVHTNLATANVARMPGTYTGRGHYADRDHDHRGRGFRGGFGLYAFGEPDYYDYYDSDGSCYQNRLVRTPYGLRWRTVDVCD